MSVRGRSWVASHTTARQAFASDGRAGRTTPLRPSLVLNAKRLMASSGYSQGPSPSRFRGRRLVLVPAREHVGALARRVDRVEERGANAGVLELADRRDRRPAR